MFRNNRLAQLTAHLPASSPITPSPAKMSTQSSSPPRRKLKIMMLHGYTQSGPSFEMKTKALKKSLEKAFPPTPKPGHLAQYPAGVELFYPTGPKRLYPSDIPGYDPSLNPHGDEPEAYGWWKRKGDSEPYTYDGLEDGLAAIAGELQTHGPFDGAIGFSQGGAAAGMVAALLEEGREEAFERRGDGMPFPSSFAGVNPPLRFAVSYSGFGASSHPLYQGFYEPKIATPMCHFIGTVDTVVEESRSLRLADSCVEGRGREGGVRRVVYHPGGHFLPSSQKTYVAALVAFIREAIGEEEGKTAAKKLEDVKAEDMDLPF